MTENLEMFDGPRTFAGIVRFLQYIKGPDRWHYVGDTGEPAFENSWVNFGANGLQDARFMKDAAGTVHIEGVIKDGTLPEAAFTLPVGYQPAYRVIYNQITNGGVGRVDIYEKGHGSQDGEVYIANGDNTWISIAVSFHVG